MRAERTEDVWGPRTPFEPGERWPERVDEYLAVEPSQVQRWVPSACVLRSNGCGMDIAVADGRMVGVRGRAQDRVNHGRLGPKGLYGWQAGNSGDRLTEPLIRVDGELRPTDWDTAMGAVVGRSRSVLANPLAMAFYTSWQLLSGVPQRQCTAQSKWLRTRMKTVAPQILATAPAAR